MRTRSQKGFTLIELMITVAVVAILAAIAIPSYRQYVIRGNRSAAKAAMMDLANREQQYLLAHRSYAYTDTLKADGYAPPSEVTSKYTWAVAPIPGETRPSFLITFTATGGQTEDGNLTLNSLGEKTPTEKWSK